MDTSTASSYKILCDILAIVFNSTAIVMLTISLFIKDAPFIPGIICMIIGWIFLITGHIIKWKWVK